MFHAAREKFDRQKNDCGIRRVILFDSSSSWAMKNSVEFEHIVKRRLQDPQQAPKYLTACFELRLREFAPRRSALWPRRREDAVKAHAAGLGIGVGHLHWARGALGRHIRQVDPTAGLKSGAVLDA